MRITEVRIDLVEDMRERPPEGSPLLAFARILLEGAPGGDDGEAQLGDGVTFAPSVVRLAICDLRVIRGKDKVFLSMPSRTVRRPCAACATQNAHTSRYCGHCGARLPEAVLAVGFRPHCDVVFPIDNPSRAFLEDAVLAAYQGAIKRRQG